MKHIYLVVGQSGQYEEHSKWVVCAYEKKTDATAHVQQANKAAAALYQKARELNEQYFDDEITYEYKEKRIANLVKRNRLDARVDVYDQSGYDVEVVPFRTALLVIKGKV